jgi:4-alpha-glucanotransferase
VVPLQDVLGLDSRGRMNVPGRDGDSWTWRLKSFDDLREPWQKLAELTRDAGR